MAEEAPPTAVSAECGFCLRSDADLVNPKQMSCSHVHCLECLTAAYNINKIVRCPACRRVYDVSLDSLPTVFIPDSSTYCDICRRKGVANQLAVMYCTSCSKTYCSKHLEHHDEVHDDHPQVTIDEYRAKARQLKPRRCTEHTGEIYGLSCRSCFGLFCMKCIPGLGNCTDGSPHQLISTDELVSELQKTLSNLTVEVMDKEGELSTLLKRTSTSISDYEMETEEMIKLIRKTRDEQLEAISLAYKELETEFVKRRNVTQSGITRFMEKELDEKLSSLCTQRLRLEVRMKDNHQVDVINGYRETREEVNRLITEELPRLHLNNSVKLQSKGASRGVELEIVSAEDVNIPVEEEKTTPTKPPQTLNLIQTVELDQIVGYVSFLCQYDGKTYVVHGNSVQVVDENCQINRDLITYQKFDSIYDITVCNNRIYTLVFSNSTSLVHVHDLEGQLINKWEHRDLQSYVLVVVNNQLVIPGQSSANLYVYSLTGQLVRQIPCPQIAGARGVSVCAGTGNDVIVRIYNSSQVIRIGISTGEVKWTLTDIATPGDVTCDGGSYILVDSEVDGVTTLHIIDINTGKVCSQMELQGGHSCKHMSLCDGILAVLSGWFSPSIQYYLMK